MPELPEVESVRNALTALIIGKRIEHMDVFWSNIIKRPTEQAEWNHRLRGSTFQRVDRKGKFLILYTEKDAIVSHLRMEGKYELSPKDRDRDTHTHIVFSFADETELRYKDVRKFGTMHLFHIGEEHQSLPLSQVGEEPIDEAFDVGAFSASLRKTKRSIKAVLLDQKIVAGLGNIYVDETLFRSGIHPAKSACELTDAQTLTLAEQMKVVLLDAIEKGGSTIRSYKNTFGELGTFQNEFLVYGRKGEKCKQCEAGIEKSIVAGRGTHFCSSCQPM
ncbi:DNA-formamidopyrimidine glycosylase [Aureibacillus halotolerans]|uniref:Formamidopyrimidine-DNA glycosylase n=1 Tax=Aureibacillus halotolerans TaxID=1508390 RepID=A0A4R6U3R9_9BACI|nr:DNA-formamidopyrimidine glycosylase [Aureibacillus halotolerans]TDQ39149.1 DNA-(apurinic or apyrimidinic site) lyase [Aureibacillus halotolerans]